jgi:dihydropteroate synthase
VDPATSWMVGRRSLDISAGVLVGIVNVTPDSFSDGGEALEPQAAIMRGLELHGQGAGMVDVGGESTRPGAEPVSLEVELERVLPVVAGLTDRGVGVSIDTSKPEVASRAIEAGATVVNDITGFSDNRMIDLCAAAGVGVVVMHMKGRPRTMQAEPVYGDVVGEVIEFLTDRAHALDRAGVNPEAIAIDPGIGFGKNVEHNLELLNRLGEVANLGYPMMIGTSRKSTLGEVTGQGTPKARDTATAVTTALGFERGARLFRVHNVVASRDALRIAAAIVGSQTWDEWQQD